MAAHNARKEEGSSALSSKAAIRRRSCAFSGQYWVVACHCSSPIKWGSHANPFRVHKAPTEQAISTPAGSASALIHAGIGNCSNRRETASIHAVDGRPGIQIRPTSSFRFLACCSKLALFSISHQRLGPVTPLDCSRSDIGTPRQCTVATSNDFAPQFKVISPASQAMGAKRPIPIRSRSNADSSQRQSAALSDFVHPRACKAKFCRTPCLPASCHAAIA